MAINIQQHAAKARGFLQDAAVHMGVTYDEAVAGRIVTAVLHSLRDHISMQESLQLIAQLPTVVKGIYVEGWKSEPPRRLHHEADFFQAVRQHLGATAGHDLGNDAMARERIQGVFQALSRYVSRGEMEDIAGQLPRELQALVLSGRTEPSDKV
ncbi:MAG: hypothetical protein RLY31_648 [Bacteroidota bacterium]|jgi:uncharacterized protein (DUF2267 family)